MTQDLRSLALAALVAPWDKNAANMKYLHNKAEFENACKAEVIIALLDERDELKAENANLLAANRDCIDHFNELKADYDKLKVAAQAGLDALHAVMSYYGVSLLSDPPQDAWKYHGVSRKVTDSWSQLRDALGPK